jgi:hypothetical protein
MPTGLAFEASFAALAAADRVARPATCEHASAQVDEWREPLDLRPGDRIACFGAEADGSVTRLAVEVPDA